MKDKAGRGSGELEPLTVRATFLYMWREFERNGFIFEAKTQPEIFREAGKQPNAHTFVCWGLVCRFWQPNADPIEVWETEARPFFEGQLLLEKRPAPYGYKTEPTSPGR